MPHVQQRENNKNTTKSRSFSEMFSSFETTNGMDFEVEEKNEYSEKEKKIRRQESLCFMTIEQRTDIYTADKKLISLYCCYYCC